MSIRLGEDGEAAILGTVRLELGESHREVD